MSKVKFYIIFRTLTPFFFFGFYIRQVAKYVPKAHDAQQQQTNESVEVLPETEQRLKEVQIDDDLQVANSGSLSSSETLDEPDIIHVVGDIVHVRCFLSFSVSHADCQIPSPSSFLQTPVTCGSRFISTCLVPL